MPKGVWMHAWALLLAVVSVAPAGAQVVEYYHLDALGSVRAVSNQDGVVIEQRDYLPFGEEWCGTAPCAPGVVAAGQPRRFTGKERDAETGLDYFGARHYGARLGRFTSVDPVVAIEKSLSDPQGWNRYAYARNRPLTNVDPDGRDDRPRWSCPGLDSPPAGDDQWYSPESLIGYLEGVAEGLVPGLDIKADTEKQERDQRTGRILVLAVDVAGLANGLTRQTAHSIAPPRSDWTQLSGMLRDAAQGKGNFSLGSATAEQAHAMGLAWVGRGYRTAKDGRVLISADGMRQYRMPTFKPREGKVQANFERKFEGQRSKGWQSNGHVDIIGP